MDRFSNCTDVPTSESCTALERLDAGAMRGFGVWTVLSTEFPAGSFGSTTPGFSLSQVRR